MTNIHEQFMTLAIEKAREGILKGQSPFGACIVKNEEVLACEHNIVWLSCDPSAHAEVNAIRKAAQKLQSIDLSGCDIYSTCEPCPMCFAAIHWARISRIFYGAAIEDAEEAGFNELPVSNKSLKHLSGSPVLITDGLLREQCRELFEFWKSRDDARSY